jgi:NAD+--asparagine ADP-ribosyltransferase
MKNVFNLADTTEFINRINRLTPDSKPNWGKMDVVKMLAHCNVTYEMIYDDIHPKPNAFKKLLLKLIVKNMVINEKPYKKNGQTAAEFIIKDTRNFEIEKKRLVNYLINTQQLGENYFDGKESHSFGVLTKQEWNNLLSKHLEHHLTQFGV